ncbi:hypothetical protein ACN50G_08605 [Lentilactobacillus buchneri]|uniref:Uncharacterized protein n=1 Tax=Lentilactobacillus buchneri DSM 20057 TaxID=1423728 RepID=A0A4R5NPS8_LENBU|nr:hypothetical protein [Lentilactobacillus buchneri]KRK67983.1 hypothetical protein FC79_GL001112 [Lentilactobacillus buchneri DSM 20057]MCT3253464.1 hypothetical protein [Lentilactobacillus buchneri]MCT3548056.1 hypothetical protein [Lentilactobacillus buchneri]MCT4438524.1 hypothetical protein [Lentilactobacillus buchneri]MQM69557.1 hypothetical protein [Lentilactobacillus buchneri]
MKITQEANAFGLYQKSTIEFNPDELKQVIRISCEEGDMDTKKLEEKLDKVLGDLFKNLDSEEII